MVGVLTTDSVSGRKHLQNHHHEHRSFPGCVLSPLLFTLLTHDCCAKYSSNHIIRFADDTTVICLISNDDSAYREEVNQLVAWCDSNNLSLNLDKTREMTVDFRRKHTVDTPLTIHGNIVESVKSTKILGVHIADDLTWTTHTRGHSSDFTS
ncbi:hypothetical protein NFI96_002273 [Prochilodus magdalenae]|nr:hypothetical protein NFI96_002273 [Prochilodus magdalenae]